MTMEALLYNPTQAREVISQAWNVAKPNLLAGRKMVIRLVDYEEAKTEQQRKYYHGYILTEITRQAKVDGNKYAFEVWKEHFRKTYLGSKRKKIIDPMTGKKSWRLERISTESLGVKGYNMLIEKVTAFACTELGVVFNETFESYTEENSL